MADLTPAEMDAVLDAHYAFEAADDVEGVLGTLTDDVVHDVVGFPGGPKRTARTACPHKWKRISKENRP